MPECPFCAIVSGEAEAHLVLEQDEVLGVLGPLQPDIVEVDSAQVGTPLPPTYQAAPALVR